MSIIEKTEVPRRTCPVIFLLDTSGSMAGQPIGAVNAAIEGVLPELVSMNNENPVTQIEIAILTFDSVINWKTGKKGLINPANYAWKDLDASGGTSMGAAFNELNNVLSASRGYMNRASGSVAPVLFLLSDGEPTDEYAEYLEKLKDNSWYKVAMRVAVGYGEFNDSVLAEFTGNTETVIHTNDPKDLKKMIKFIAITSSMVASKGKAVAGQGNEPGEGGGDPPQSGNDMTNALADALKNNPPSLADDDVDFDFN